MKENNYMKVYLLKIDYAKKKAPCFNMICIKKANTLFKFNFLASRLSAQANAYSFSLYKVLHLV